MPKPRMAFSFGNSARTRLCPNNSIDSRWIKARKRTLDPHAQLAGSVPNDSILLCVPQILQMKAIKSTVYPDNVAHALVRAASALLPTPGYESTPSLHRKRTESHSKHPRVARNLRSPADLNLNLHHGFSDKLHRQQELQRKRVRALQRSLADQNPIRAE